MIARMRTREHTRTPAKEYNWAISSRLVIGAGAQRSTAIEGKTVKYKLLPAIVAVFIFILGNSHTTLAQGEVSLVAPGGIQTAIEQIIPSFEKKTGFKVKVTFGPSLITRAQVAHGDAFDVPIVQPPYQEVLASGNVVASSETPLATIAVGVAVRKGAPKPDISTPEAVKQMLLAAKSITFTNGTAGVTFKETMKKLGIFDEMQSKIKLGQGADGPVAMVARGEVEIVLTFLSEMNGPGVDIVGPLPASISPPISLVGFVSSHAKDPVAARALLEFLSSPDAAAVYKARGLTPTNGGGRK